MNFLIPDKEPQLTESEIMKALEDQKCVYLANGVFVFDALDLINRKNAEIAVYKNNLEAMATTMHNSAKAERAEAIKEFAERVKRKAKTHFPLHNEKEVYSSVRVKYIDQIAKEMGVE